MSARRLVLAAALALGLGTAAGLVLYRRRRPGTAHTPDDRY